MQNCLVRKGLVIGIIILFLGASIIPSISGNIRKINDIKGVETITVKDAIQTNKNEPHKLSTTDWWPMFRHDLQHSGYSTSDAPDTNNVKWNYKTKDIVISSPVVVDGMVYFRSGDGYFYCLNAIDGKSIWMRWSMDGAPFSSPAVANGKVYIDCIDKYFYCLDAYDGRVIWSKFIGYKPCCSPIVVNEKVYTSSKFRLWCLNANDGSEIWSREINDNIFSAAFSDEKLYFKISPVWNIGTVYCLDANDGSEIWTYPIGRTIAGTPAVVNGKVYFGSYNENFYCLNANTGNKIWTYKTDGMVTNSPAVAYGNVYFGTSDQGKMYCLNANSGSKIWSYLIGEHRDIKSSPAVADGKVYVGADDDKVYCLDAYDGSEIWSYESWGYWQSSPAVADGKVYVGSCDERLYCFGDVSPNIPEWRWGALEVEIGETYSCCAESHDPNGDDVALLFNWGDGTDSGWIWGDYPGEVYKVAYKTWDNLGTYEVKVKAKDEHGYESEWSEPKMVEVKYSGLYPGDVKTSFCYDWHTTLEIMECVLDCAIEYKGWDYFESTERWHLGFIDVNYFSYDEEWTVGELYELSLRVTSDSDCDVQKPFYRKGGYNVKLIENPDPNLEPYINFGLVVCTYAIDLFAFAGIPVTTFTTSGLQLVSNLADSVSIEPDVTWEINDTSSRDGSGLIWFDVAIDPKASHPDGNWEIVCNAGADYDAHDGLGRIGLILDIDLPYYGWYGNGKIRFHGPIPPVPETLPPEMFYWIYCPVNVTVYLPSGHYISNTHSTIDGAYYNEIDLDGDGDLDKEIYIPRGWYGDYSIFVNPHPDADPDETFTIVVNSEGENITLVEDMKISEVNSSVPFIFNKEESDWGVNINGPTSGKPGKSYDYTISGTTLYGMGIHEFCVDWGDGNTDLVTGPFEPDVDIIVSHTWTEKGTYIIRIKAKDQLGQVSDWAELKVTMPRNKQYTNTPFLNFLENHPNLFPILQKLLLQRLGL